MRTFLDDDHEADYRADGFTTITLVTPDVAADIARRTAPLVRTQAGSFKATLYDDDQGYRTEVDATLKALLADALTAQLHEQRCFVANLLVKPPGAGTELGVHQDWTFVDESTATSATVWCPLVDVDETNGTLVLYRGSHLFGPSYRGSPRLPTPFDGAEEAIRSAAGTPVRCVAGQAVVYDHRVVHWSGPNLTETTRIAVGLGIAPVGVPLIHLHAAPDGRVTRYLVPDDFLHDIEFGSPPARHGGAEPFEIPAPASGSGSPAASRLRAPRRPRWRGRGR